jgi:hypothetical protein
VVTGAAAEVVHVAVAVLRTWVVAALMSVAAHAEAAPAAVDAEAEAVLAGAAGAVSGVYG